MTARSSDPKIKSRRADDIAQPGPGLLLSIAGGGAGKPRRAEAAGAVADAGRRDRRAASDGMAAATIDRIVLAAQRLMMKPGAARVTAKDVCRAAAVSRGTLYRYFGSMDEILEAVTLRLRDRTDREMRRAVQGSDDPNEQFEAFLTYMTTNQEAVGAARLIEVEPLFVIDYLRKNFDHFNRRVLALMGPVYDSWQSHLGRPIDREAITELMVRYVLSELVVPTSAATEPLPLRLRGVVESFIGARIGV